MAPSCIFSLLLPLNLYYVEQDILITAKRACLDEIVGHLKEEKEEEPESEVLGDKDTGSLLYSSLLPINFTDLIHIAILFTLPAPFFLSFPFR